MVKGVNVEAVLDALDSNFTGLIDKEQIQVFYESYYNSRIDLRIIELAILSVCSDNSSGKCTREKFVDVIAEINKRKTLEEQLHWDFKSLDRDGDWLITVQDAYLLLQSYCGKKFSMTHWKNFVHARRFSETKVCYEEIRTFMNSIPTEDLNTEEEVEKEGTLLSQMALNNELTFYREIKTFEENKIDNRAEKAIRNRNERLTKTAKRYLKILNTRGIEAMLYDKGYSSSEEDELVTVTARNRISTKDLFDILNRKYECIRESTICDMIRRHVGEGMWMSLNVPDKKRRVKNLGKLEQQLRKSGFLDEIINLDGAQQRSPHDLISLIGEPIFAVEIHLSEELQKRNKLRESGLSTEEIDRQLLIKAVKKYDNTSCSYSQILNDLAARQNAETDFLWSDLRSVEPQFLKTANDRLKQYLKFVRQLCRARLDLRFHSVSLSVGLVLDQIRQEKLAHERLSERRRGDTPTMSQIDEVDMNLYDEYGVVDLLEATVRTLEQKQAHERNKFIEMLQGSESLSVRSNVRKMNIEERQNQYSLLKIKRRKWRESSEEERIARKTQNHQILQEATAIYYENARDIKANDREVDVAVAMLAELQCMQDQECERFLTDVAEKSNQELIDIRNEFLSARQEDLLDNVSSLVLKTDVVRTKEEVELVKALEEKYDMLKEKLILDALKTQMGDAEWAKLSERERQARLMKLKLEERKLRNEGKFDEVARLLGESIKNHEQLNQLMGHNRAMYDQQLKDRLARRKQLIIEGNDLDKIEMEEGELPEDNQVHSNVNLLDDLEARFNAEKEALLAMLHGAEGQAMSERERQAELLRLRLETRKGQMEDRFDTAAMMLGLAERNQAAANERLQGDRKRQEKLALERLAERKARNGKKIIIDEELEPEEGDIVGWRDSVLKEMEKKHCMERELLLQLMQDEESGESSLNTLKIAAVKMEESKRQECLVELRGNYDAIVRANERITKIRKFFIVDREEILNILQEAALVKYASRKMKMEFENGTLVDDNTVYASIMADLQINHSKESEEMSSRIMQSSMEELIQQRAKQIEARQDRTAENVANIITKYEGAADDDYIISALEKKYESLKDKLLEEVLIQQFGDDSWTTLSEKDRQQRLVQLKFEEKKLVREGRYDDAAALLGDGFAIESNLKKLMGESRPSYESQLKERLEKRRLRMLQGQDKEDNSESELEETFNEEKSCTKELLLDLDNRLKEEKEALSDRLRGADNYVLTERERQVELVRLRRESRMAQQEHDFDAAAIQLGLLERSQATTVDRLKYDRYRQERLAEKRLKGKVYTRSTLPARKMQEVEISDPKYTDLVQMQNTLISATEIKHIEERKFFVDLLSKERESVIIEMIEIMSEDERECKLQDLLIRLDTISPDEEGEQGIYWNILAEAAVIKIECRKSTLIGERKIASITNDDVIVSLLADLNEIQQTEIDKIISQLARKNESEIKSIHEKQLQRLKEMTYQNVNSVLFNAEPSKFAGESQITEALNGKYDALRDKLLAEALAKQLGDAQWKKLSEQERQLRLMKLKRQERKLRQENRYDELANILELNAEAESNVQGLLMDSKLKHEQRLQERLKKRKQRLSEGMSESEVDKLEKKEDEEYNRKLKLQNEDKSIVGLLRNLKDCYEDDKAALMAGLSNAEGQMLSEKERQMQLARLKREQRRARQEDQFDAALLALTLAQSQNEAANKAEQLNRQRQEHLARERLAARKKKLRSNSTSTQKMTVDTESLGSLQEAILQNIDIKHNVERDVLIRILNKIESHGFENLQAKALSAEGRNQRLTLLMQIWQKMFMSASDSLKAGEEQDSIFNEAAGLRLVNDYHRASSEGGSKLDYRDICVSILADLQQRQDGEVQNLSKEIDSQNLPNLKKLYGAYSMAIKGGWFDDIASVLFGAVMKESAKSTELNDEALVNALEEKYDTFRDKLLMEVLKAQAGGEAAWMKLSEKERNEQLVKLKIEEKKLRESGRLEEAAALSIKGLSKETLASFGSTFGLPREPSKRKDHDRLNSNLDTLEEENEDRSYLKDFPIDETITKNAIINLQANFDNEKEALLSSLRSANNKYQSEKDRQLMLAKIRRQQKKVAREDKFESAALVFSIAASQEAAREESFKKSRARQEELARGRLAQRRLLLKQKKGSVVDDVKVVEANLKQEAESDERDEVLHLSRMKQGGLLSSHEVVLSELEKKHATEQELLFQILGEIESDLSIMEPYSLMSQLDRDQRMSDLRVLRTEWKEQSMEAAFDEVPEEIILNICNRVNELVKVSSKTPEEMQEEISVALLTDLQEKQTAENSAVERHLVDKDEAFLNRFATEQKISRREGWYDNLVKVVLSPSVISADDDIDDTDEQETQIAQQEIQNHLLKLNENFETDKDALMKVLASQVYRRVLEKRRLRKEHKQRQQKAKDANETVPPDIDLSDDDEEIVAELDKKTEVCERSRALQSEEDLVAALSLLEAMHQAQRTTLNSELERQKTLARKKLEEKRYKRQLKDYEDEVANSMIAMAEKTQLTLMNSSKNEKNRQKDILRNRLAAKKERKRTLEQKQKEILEKSKQDAIQAKKSRRRSQQMQLPADIGLRRERTVVDVDVSEEKKKELLDKIQHNTDNLQKRRLSEKLRQQNQLKAKLESMRAKRVGEANALLGMGERQKTIVMEERERQKTVLQERIARVRYERTQTSMTIREDNPDAESRSFDQLLGSDENLDLNNDERMERAAQRMQESFIQKHTEQTEAESKPIFKRASVILEKRTLEQKLKDRIASRKLQRKQKEVSEVAEVAESE
ncbi:uncharacterized protein TRIADDRAFT_52404 [Trichoplax adhaerens]|uniref:EF-hand domain-containing protein n=1 Tax=Trichoplax adhaerens TaxID=10228 RepID=B3RIA4_TRIAD|nr:hypothetical protein TRIADDRAFT_52404 [Trichoplax adhaerens]EDV29717.1 hypothetical protein TRIADDRAFT_52404 [Trichoplax adhaerens]|eukprot:XP_002108919.1 hypothetical protein TRIADDRAFT_52404 [Trichoplax adhaerens]